MLKDKVNGKTKNSGVKRILYKTGQYDAYLEGKTKTGLPHKVPLAYPTHNHWEHSGQTNVIPWTADLLMAALQDTLAQWKQTYGGEWILRIERNKKW
jgi:hypothetical protein